VSLYIEAETDRPIGDADDAPPIDPEVAGLAGGLRDAYELRVEAYHRELTQEFSAQPSDSPEPPASSYPRVMLPSAEPGEQPEEIIVDPELFVVLFDLYTVEGWAPIARLERVLGAQAKIQGHPDQPSAGTPELKWVAAYRFFVYCRNMLALLIREVLIDLERRAAQQILARVSVTAARVSAAVTKELRITKSGSTYSFGNQALVKLLVEKVGEAVAQRVAWEELADSIGGYAGALNRANYRVERARKHGVQPRAFDVEEAKRLAAIVAKKSELRTATRDWYASMKNIIAINVPLAALVVDSLKPGFQQAELEAALGEAIWGIYARLDGLGVGIDPEVSMVAKQFTGLPPQDGQKIGIGAVQRLNPPAVGLERDLAVAAVAGVGSAPAYFPLVHDMTMRLLVYSGEVSIGSFEYVVMHHYLASVDDVLEEIADNEKAVKAFFSGFAKVAAALSIALLVTPAAEVAPALRGAATVADLAVLAYSACSAIDQLTRLDEAITAKLLEPGAFAGAAMARIGELVFIRREFATQLTEQLVLEFLATMAAGQWQLVRRLLIARGFLLDVETLLEDDDAE